jgi:hypothetical protein
LEVAEEDVVEEGEEVASFAWSINPGKYVNAAQPPTTSTTARTM